MATLSVCPCCGTDITLDKAVVINDFSMLGPAYPIYYKKTQVPMQRACTTICYALMKAYPGHLTCEALAERIGSESDNPDNIVKVYVCRARRAFREIGVKSPIDTLLNHHAYVWDPRT